MTLWLASLASQAITFVWVRRTQVATLWACHNMTLAAERDIKHQL